MFGPTMLRASSVGQQCCVLAVLANNVASVCMGLKGRYSASDFSLGGVCTMSG